MVVMNIPVIRWGNDLAMGVSFLVCFITGMFKFTVFMRLSGLTTLVLPIAQMSNLHDWSGIALGFFVAVHLVLNRTWIMTMTRKILAGEKIKP
jgi:cytochrome b subunit of formate dehydrogenase